MVPESQHPITQRLKKRGTPGVVIDPRRMLTAVQLHDQLPLTTAEVNDVRADRHLARELHAEKTAIAQARP
jgi:hypothetical protein